MPSSGGDRPEYALFAMKKALEAKDDDGVTLMVEGSQMVVLTDAPSKQHELTDTVIGYALRQSVCIHFFVNHPEYSLEDGIYQRIAEGTHGTLISSFSQWNITDFVAKYEENDGCEFLAPRKRRSASLSISSCKLVTVSRLSANLRLSIASPTGSSVRISHPDGRVDDLLVIRNNFILFNQTNPVHGPWKVCSTGEHSIQVTDVVTYRIDTTVFYWSPNITSVTPPACKYLCCKSDTHSIMHAYYIIVICSFLIIIIGTAGRIVIITSKLSSIQSAYLDFVPRRSGSSTIMPRVNLTKGCEGTLVSDVLTFPNGSYTYHITGTDIDGVPFKYHSKRIVTYRQPIAGEFSFEPVASLAVEMDTDEIAKIEYDFTNRGAYDTNFDFIVNTPDGLATRIDPSSLLVAPGTTVKLQVSLHVIDCPIKRGTLHTVKVTAQISCTEQQIQAPTRSVTYRQPENGEFLFEPVGSIGLEMDRDEIVKLDYKFTNRGTYNKTFKFLVNAPEGLATHIDPSNLLVAAGVTVKLQVLLRVIHSSIKRGTLHTVNVTAISCTGQQIQAPAKSVFIVS